MVCEKCKAEIEKAIDDSVERIKKQWEQAGHYFLANTTPDGFTYLRKRLKLKSPKGRELKEAKK